MSLAFYDWIVIYDQGDSDTICAASIEDVIKEITSCQPIAIVRGGRRWDKEAYEADNTL